MQSSDMIALAGMGFAVLNVILNLRLSAQASALKVYARRLMSSHLRDYHNVRFDDAEIEA